MKDNYGDKIIVDTDTEFDHDVSLYVFDSIKGSEAGATLSPAKARKLAKLLKAAANEVDPPHAPWEKELLAVPRPTKVDEWAPEGFWLALTKEEAETLSVILGRIGGPCGFLGRTSPRLHASAVADKLAALGVASSDDLEDSGRYEIDRHGGEAIYFKAST